MKNKMSTLLEQAYNQIYKVNCSSVRKNYMFWYRTDWFMMTAKQLTKPLM